MVRPKFFSLNEQTIVNNYYQSSILLDSIEISELAKKEFDAAVHELRSHHLNVLTVEDSDEVITPDSIFPNNWFSTDENGGVFLYPMFAENRRLERRSDLKSIFENAGFSVKSIVDWSSFEDDNLFLEGTGSLVLDRFNRRAYASISDRTHSDLVLKWCKLQDYHPVLFHSHQRVGEERKPVYHTNVVMALGTSWAVICADAVVDPREKEEVIKSLEQSRELFLISESEMNSFAGNILELKSNLNETLIVMSKTAFSAVHSSTLISLEKYGKIVVLNIPTIEKVGGGSARCMIAEVFLPKS